MNRKAITRMQSIIILVIIIAAVGIGTYYYYTSTITGREKIVLKAMVSGETTKALLDRWNEHNPDIQVETEIVPFPIYTTKILSYIAAGEAPDIFLANWPDIYVLGKMGALVELDDYFYTWEDSDQFYEGIIEGCKWNGKLYGIPVATDFRLIYYNKVLFEEAGVNPPETWEELLEVAKVLTKDIDGDGEIDQWGYAFHTGPGGSTNARFMTMLWGLGGRYFDDANRKVVVNGSAGIKVLQYYYDAIHVYKVAPAELLSGSELELMLAEGRLAMFQGGTWEISGFKEVLGKEDITDIVGVTIMPRWEKGVEGLTLRPHANYAGGWRWTITKQSKYKEEAWEVIKYISSKEVLLDYCKENYAIPIRKDVAENPFFTGDPYFKYFVQYTQYSTTPTGLDGEYYNQIKVYIIPAIQEVVTGIKTPKEALDEAAAKLQDVIRFG